MTKAQIIRLCHVHFTYNVVVTFWHTVTVNVDAGTLVKLIRHADSAHLFM